MSWQAFLFSRTDKQPYMHALQQQIEAAYANRELLKDETYISAIREVIEEVDKGKLLSLIHI